MDAQAGLRLCCLQPPEDRFSCVEAHIGFVANTADIDPVFGPIGNYEISGNLLAL